LLAAILRAWLVAGPYRELDADEAVVGLMALNFPGERPAFFWEQRYLGSLESVTAWAVFQLAGPSEVSLKSVPAAFSLLFVGLVYVSARLAFGQTVGLMTLAYLAVPPSFLAAWSVKARGGYAEVLALGQLMFVTVQMWERSATRRQAWAATAGLAGGLALWTHPIAVLYLVPCAIVAVSAVRRRGIDAKETVLASAGFVVGAWPAIAENVSNGFASFRFVGEGGTAPAQALLNGWGVLRYGGPVLAGLAEGTATKLLLDADWASRPGSQPVIAAALWVAIGLVLWARRRLLFEPASARALPMLLVMCVPPFVAVSRIAELWAEPRYLLPVYSAVPLVMMSLLEMRRRWLAPAAFVGLLVINVVSLATMNPRLAMPVSAGETTRANRAELIAALDRLGLDRVYTDYWLAYPLAFDSRERIVPDVWIGGFSRRAAYSHLVSVDPNPAFVFAAGTMGDDRFRERLSAIGGEASTADVSIYRVYWDVRPLAPMRGREPSQ
jgi:hypothetical protein